MNKEMEDRSGSGTVEELLEDIEAVALECDIGDVTAMSHKWVAERLRNIIRKNKDGGK